MQNIEELKQDATEEKDKLARSEMNQDRKQPSIEGTTESYHFGLSDSLTIRMQTHRKKWMSKTDEKAKGENQKERTFTYNKVFTILAVDDSEFVRKALETLPAKIERKFDFAKNGVEALKKYLDSINQGVLYHLVLMDLQMPVMDGFEAARAIRDEETEKNYPRTYICAISAFEDQETINMVKREGMDNFCRKLLRMEGLDNLIQARLEEITEEKDKLATTETTQHTKEPTIEEVNKQLDLDNVENIEKKVLSYPGYDSLSHEKVKTIKGENQEERTFTYKKAFAILAVNEKDKLDRSEMNRDRKQPSIEGTNKEQEPEKVEDLENKLLPYPRSDGLSDFLTIRMQTHRKKWMSKTDEKAKGENQKERTFTYNKVFTILAVDDSEFVRKALETLPAKIERKFDFAKNGVEALKKYLDSINQGVLYHLVLMDLQMPVMDGFEAARAIRDEETEKNYPRTYICAISAFEDQETINMVKREGMDNFCQKPLRMEGLDNLIQARLEEITEEKDKLATTETTQHTKEPTIEEVNKQLDLDNVENIEKKVLSYPGYDSLPHEKVKTIKGENQEERTFTYKKAFAILAVNEKDKLDRSEMNRDRKQPSIEGTNKEQEPEKVEDLENKLLPYPRSDGLSDFLTIRMQTHRKKWMSKTDEKAKGENQKERTFTYNKVFTILAVDDSEFVRKALETLPAKIERKFDFAKNGVEALKKYLDSINQGVLYHLVLMDLQMPVMDGFEAARAIRDEETEKNYPRTYICAISAFEDQETINMVKREGMDNFCQKPLRMEGLDNLIKTRLEEIGIPPPELQ